MSFNLFLTPGTTPAELPLPGNAQALVNMIAQYVLIAGDQNVGGINYGVDTPAPELRDFPWWRTDNSGNPIGMFNWNGSDWVTVNPPMPSGPSTDRPLNPATGTQFFDTTISVALIYERGKWRTLAGSPGDIKETLASTIELALTQNPGWLQHTDSNGAVIGGAGANPGRGMTTRAFGEWVGEEEHAITEDELPSHKHTTTANWGEGGEGGGDNPLYYDNAQAPANPQVQPDTGSTGGDEPMSLMQPTQFFFRLYKE